MRSRRPIRPRWADVELQARNGRYRLECRTPRRAALDHAPQLSQGDAGAQREGSEPLLLDPLPNCALQIADTRETSHYGHVIRLQSTFTSSLHVIATFGHIVWTSLRDSALCAARCSRAMLAWHGRHGPLARRSLRSLRPEYRPEHLDGFALRHRERRDHRPAAAWGHDHDPACGTCVPLPFRELAGSGGVASRNPAPRNVASLKHLERVVNPLCRAVAGWQSSRSVHELGRRAALLECGQIAAVDGSNTAICGHLKNRSFPGAGDWRGVSAARSSSAVRAAVSPRTYFHSSTGRSEVRIVEARS